MIYYRGREQPCFFRRKIPPCKKLSAFRVDGQYVMMHVCEEHLAEATDIAKTGEVTTLVSDGLDTMPATSMDPEGLLAAAPWIERIEDPRTGKVWSRS